MTEPADHETYLFAGGRTTILVDGASTKGRFSILLDTQPPKNSTPPHFHDVDQETLLVLDGAMQVETEDGVFDLPAGATRALPPEKVHRLANVSDAEATTIITCTPAGFEDFVRTVGERTSDREAAPRPMTQAEVELLTREAGRFGVRLVAPDK